jgi:large subunit ribosomal protein L21
MFAVIETGGKQYHISAGDTIRVEKLSLEAGAPVVFDRVLLRSNKDDVVVGQPYVEGAKVEGKITAQGREKKKIVFRYKSKTRYRKKHGHRQEYTDVEILGIK